MKLGASFLAGVASHFAVAALVLAALAWLPKYGGRPLDGTLVFVILLIAGAYVFFGIALLKARMGSPGWIKTFGIGGGVFVGSVIGLGGWDAAWLCPLPLVIGLYALWRAGMLANSALLTDTSSSPRRARRGAAKRER